MVINKEDKAMTKKEIKIRLEREASMRTLAIVNPIEKVFNHLR